MTITTTRPTNYHYYFYLVASLLCCFNVLVQGQTTVTELKCWSGVSNPKATTGYPPEQVDCSILGGGSTCQLTYIATLSLYSMSCTTDTACQLLVNDLESGSTTSLYDYVKCCTEDLCNADPNMPSSGSSLYDANFHWSILGLVLGARLFSFSLESLFTHNEPPQGVN